MSKKIDKVKIITALNRAGFYIHRGFDKDIGLDLDETLNELSDLASGYSELAVKQQIYRPRENHSSRVGNALMSTVGNPKYAPYLNLQGQKKNLSKLQTFYNEVLSAYFEKDMTDTKSLLNWQMYTQGGDNSLPFHVDSEFFDGSWEKESIDIKRALIPKFVMVMITENENDGAGLELLSNGGEVGLELHPGDMVIFDNQNLMHGVPRGTPNKRSMVGFRNFEAFPMYFEKNKFDKSVAYNNGFMNGFSKVLSVDEAQDTLVKEGVSYA